MRSETRRSARISSGVAVPDAGDRDFLKAADEGELTQEQFLFLMAIDKFKQVNGKTFPSWTDVLEVVRRLGYRKTMSSELNLGKRAEDWTERADSPSGVDMAADDEA